MFQCPCDSTVKFKIKEWGCNLDCCKQVCCLSKPPNCCLTKVKPKCCEVSWFPTECSQMKHKCSVVIDCTKKCCVKPKCNNFC